MNVRSRGWCYTCNNYSEETVARLQEVSVVSEYLCFGREIAPTTETPHLQGYLFFKEAKSFSKIQKLLPHGSHIEIAKGSPQDNYAYCSKGGAFTEFGKLPIQGKRNDLQQVRDIVASGGGMKEIIDTASNYQAMRMGEMVLKYKEQKRNWKPKVVWIYGPSGTGKTRHCYAVHPDLFRKTNAMGKWWDGYDADPFVLMDDLKDSSAEMFTFLLELLDRYDCRVECKGGSRQMLAKEIYITSIDHPSVLFSWKFNLTELLRRIDQIVELKIE